MEGKKIAGDRDRMRASRPKCNRDTLKGNIGGGKEVLKEVACSTVNEAACFN